MSDTISSKADLEAMYGEPVAIAVAMKRPALDEHHRNFIAHSPFVCIAACDGTGAPSLSPKGDAPGFVQVADDTTLIIPDRPGNNQLATLHNIVANSKVALLFLIPGVRENLRVEGEARIVRDEEILASNTVSGKLPPSALVIKVKKAYIHCGKCVIRSKLWDPKQHVPKGTIAPLGKIAKDEVETDITLSQMDGLVDELYRDKLY